MIIILRDKADARKFKWLKAGTSKDPMRYSLNGVFTTQKYMVTTDGIQMRVIQRPDEIGAPEPNTLVMMNHDIRLADKGIPYEVDDGTFPHALDTVPRKEPLFQIALSAKRLKELLTNIGEGENLPVVISFHGKSEPVEISVATDALDKDAWRYSLLMPIHLELDDYPLRPQAESVTPSADKDE